MKAIALSSGIKLGSGKLAPAYSGRQRLAARAEFFVCHANNDKAAGASAAVAAYIVGQIALGATPALASTLTGPAPSPVAAVAGFFSNLKEKADQNVAKNPNPLATATPVAQRSTASAPPTLDSPAPQIPPSTAAELLTAGGKYLDVRTPEEFSQGHAKGAVNIPSMLRSDAGMVPNANFLDEVTEKFPDTSETVVVACKAGSRSTPAAALLHEKYKNLANMSAGFDGWVAAGMPVEK